jgi:hypothetical protein
MRFVVGALACMAVGGISLALADPSTTASAPSPPSAPSAPTAPAAAAPAPAPATPAAPATPQAAPAAAATPAIDPEEKRLMAAGYRMQMRHGEKVFCRREEVLGSRLEGKMNCSTAQQLKSTQDQAQEAAQRLQRQNLGHPPGS